MTERDDNGGKSGRQPAEGVRIIKAEEAKAALEAGEAAGRRPDSQLRYGDVPPVPSGPRPAHRFPLPDSVDPAEAVALPPLASPRPPGDTPARRPAPRPEPDRDWRAVSGDDEEDPFEPPAGPEDDTAEEPVAARPAAPPDPPPTVEEPPPPPDWEPTVALTVPPPDPEMAEERPPPEPEPEPEPERWPEPGLQPRSAGGQEPEPPPEPEFRPEPAYRPAPDPAAAEADSPPRFEGSFEPRTSWAPPPAPEQVTHDKEPLTSMESPWRSNPAAMFEDNDDRTTEMGVPEEGITVSGGVPEMPHWSDPPTGEVPRLRFDDTADEPEEDLEAWKAIGSRGVRWRDEDDWNDADELSDLVSDEEPIGVLDSSRAEHSDIYSFDEDFERVTNRTGSQPVVDLTDVEAEPEEDYEPSRRRSRDRRSSRSSRRDESRRGQSRRPASGVRMVFGADEVEPPAMEEPHMPADEDEQELVGAGRSVGARPARRTPSHRPPVRHPSGASPRRGGGGAGATPSRGGDLSSRVGIGVALVALLIICYAIGAEALLALTALILVAAAAEAYAMIRGAGFRPATLLGLVATVGCVLAAYWKGPGAIPVVTVFLFAGTMLWYVLGIVEARPLANVAVTVMVFVWVAVLGSFAAVMLAQHSGQGEFLGAIVVAVVADVAAFAVGRWIGSRPLAAHISPHKTVEGFVGGLVGALIAGAVIGKELAPWGGMKHGVVLGLIVGLIAPVGDLFESMLKRDLGLKDSGTILAGHGGLLDRFDGVLLALPAAYFVITFFKL